MNIYFSTTSHLKRKPQLGLGGSLAYLHCVKYHLDQSPGPSLFQIGHLATLDNYSLIFVSIYSLHSASWAAMNENWDTINGLYGQLMESFRDSMAIIASDFNGRIGSDNEI